MMAFLNNKRRLIALVMAIVFAALVCVTVYFFAFQERKTPAQQEPEAWMTIFVHGTFGSLLGFLNFFDVLGDKVSGTLYRTVTKKMRNDSFFFKDQAILQRGLVGFIPSFDLVSTGGKKMAAYPIAKAFLAVLEAANPEHERNYFYAFGWSGLISQNSRRFEAIRFYNALAEELEQFAKRGIRPKIRIISHSHGGNISLNMAAIEKILKNGGFDESKVLSSDPDENESLQRMRSLLKELPNKEKAKTRTDQKIYDYVPTYRDLVIDELIMYGSPVQPETESFFHSGTFKNVYHLYSEEDYVQRLDWVSSKKPLSGQRLSHYPALKKTGANGAGVRVVQAKIMSEKTMENKAPAVVPSKKEAAPKPEEKKATEPTVIGELFAGRNVFVKGSKDPTHKELWFMMWADEQHAYTSFLHPLPTVIMTPLIVNALKKAPELNDVDVNINATETKVTVYIAPHDQTIVRSSATIPRAVIEHIQDRIKVWQPEDVSPTAEFNAIYRHLK